MSKSGNENLVLGLSLLVTASLLGGGYWFFSRSSQNPATVTETIGNTGEMAANQANNASLQDIQVSLPNPTIISIDGSVTMVRMMKQLQVGFSQKNPSIPTTYGVPDGRPNGSNKALDLLVKGQVMIAANSRSLTASEVQQGLRAIPVGRDALAIVVGINNPFKGGLTMAQLKEIYQGKITNWAQVGGADIPIKVINRANASGTQSLFRSVVLLDEPFAADSNNFITWERDETTPILQRLGNDGISYTTVSQAVGQEIVRILPINGSMPTSIDDIRNSKYPISRVISLTVMREISPVVKEFIEFTLSAQGQALVQSSGFVPL
jgi:phosphate transport system substrate-binding protein